MGAAGHGKFFQGQRNLRKKGMLSLPDDQKIISLRMQEQIFIKLVPTELSVEHHYGSQ